MRLDLELRMLPANRPIIVDVKRAFYNNSRSNKNSRKVRVTCVSVSCIILTSSSLTNASHCKCSNCHASYEWPIFFMLCSQKPHSRLLAADCCCNYRPTPLFPSKGRIACLLCIDKCPPSHLLSTFGIIQLVSFSVQNNNSEKSAHLYIPNHIFPLLE